MARLKLERNFSCGVFGVESEIESDISKLIKRDFGLRLIVVRAETKSKLSQGCIG